VFVGEFIGSPKMNVQPGTLEVAGGVAIIECLGVRTKLSSEIAGRIEGLAPGGSVLVGIRPHDLHLAGESGPESERVHGVIDIVEHTGTEVFATIDVGETKVIARLPRTPLPVHGQKVELAFNADRVLLFDVESRKSLLRRDSEREKVSIR
jgi:ABC-type sugar transport system ATPase subunit